MVTVGTEAPVFRTYYSSSSSYHHRRRRRRRRRQLPALVAASQPALEATEEVLAWGAYGGADLAHPQGAADWCCAQALPHKAGA